MLLVYLWVIWFSCSLRSTRRFIVSASTVLLNRPQSERLGFQNLTCIEAEALMIKDVPLLWLESDVYYYQPNDRWQIDSNGTFINLLVCINLEPDGSLVQVTVRAVSPIMWLCVISDLLNYIGLFFFASTILWTFVYFQSHTTIKWNCFAFSIKKRSQQQKSKDLNLIAHEKALFWVIMHYVELWNCYYRNYGEYLVIFFEVTSFRFHRFILGVCT